jgi:hypothetical protein
VHPAVGGSGSLRFAGAGSLASRRRRAGLCLSSAAKSDRNCYPVRMTDSPTPEPTGPVPVLKGCPSGTVAISYPGQGDWTVCIRAAARLRLTLPDDGYGSWAPLQVTPTGAATVASTTDSKGNVHAIVTPTGTATFCLGTDLSPMSPTAPDFPWHMCVSIQR